MLILKYQTGMDLQTFITQTIASIIEGVKSAQERYPAGSGSAAVNHIDRDPQFAGTPDLKASPIEFDIAITSSTSEEQAGEKKGGLNIRVVEASATGKRASSSRDEEVSRVRFVVPITLPVTETSAHHEAIERTDAERAERRANMWNDDGM